MLFKKKFFVFLLILFFLFSFFLNVNNYSFAENINITSESSVRMKSDIDYLKQIFKNNNINNMNDLANYFGINTYNPFTYLYIQDAGHIKPGYQLAYFYYSVSNISVGTNDYSYYGIQQNSFSLSYGYELQYHTNDTTYLRHFENTNNSTFQAPVCWLCVRTADLFLKDSSEIVENAVQNVNNSINNLQNTISDDNLQDNTISIDTSNSSDASESTKANIKNNSIYHFFENLFSNFLDKLNYSDDDVVTKTITIKNTDFTLSSDITKNFFNHIGASWVVFFWQGFIWFITLFFLYKFLHTIYFTLVSGGGVDEIIDNTKSYVNNDDILNF